MEELDKVIGLPWQLKPSAAPDGTRAGAAAEKEIRIELAPDDASVPEPVVEKKRKGYVPRGLYIRRDIELQQFGYTAGCDGCEAAREGLAHRQHTKACKKRIAEELERSDEGKKRVQQMREREERYIVAFQERAEREEQKKRRSEAEEEDRRKRSSKVEGVAEEDIEIDKVLRIELAEVRPERGRGGAEVVDTAVEEAEGDRSGDRDG
ncbi:unnamed protein product [Effrenium voratum]|nr:unnamed protein product [Effrenium voratum]